MESPSCSVWSDGFLVSDDSGLILTSGSISSGDISGGESRNSKLQLEPTESDFEKSILQSDSSFEDENFNTLKKVCLNEIEDFSKFIEPPPEFQDTPKQLDKFAIKIVSQILNEAYQVCTKIALSIHPSKQCQASCSFNVICRTSDRSLTVQKKKKYSMNGDISIVLRGSMVMAACSSKNIERIYWSPDIHATSVNNSLRRPLSRNSASSGSRLYSSHNSLNVSTLNRCHDDSSFITQAMSHDVLTHVTSGYMNQENIYNVPYDSDIYTLPVDSAANVTTSMTSSSDDNTTTIEFKRRPSIPTPPPPPKVRSKQFLKYQRKRRRNVSANSQQELQKHVEQAQKLNAKTRAVSHVIKSQALLSEVVCATTKQQTENSDSDLFNATKRHSMPGLNVNSRQIESEPIHMTLQEVRQYLHTLYSDATNDKMINEKKSFNKKHKYIINNKKCDSTGGNKTKIANRLFSFKRTLCSLFKFRRCSTKSSINDDNTTTTVLFNLDKSGDDKVQKRALPPLPKNGANHICNEISMDFASSIQKVKDYGWYWGPISGEAAEKVLSNEPDGSFIVRDSSDDHYIFSLTFKLNSCVRHVRIEHDQGNFSFGSCTKFKSHTIVEFIENAVQHSRSGRYLFFLHRRPVLGPMRVQLLHPVSRFKQVQSLQHMCRFVILKLVRKDLIERLPLPRRIIDYLNTKHYYSEQLLDYDSSDTSAASDNKNITTTTTTTT